MRILVADDDATARLLMRAALTKAGFKVNEAVDGEDALRLFRDERYDMVMLDVEMPGLNGYQVCSSIRGEAETELPIVMVTGMDDIDSIEMAYRSGATDFITKPITWPLIGHRVRYLFRAYRATLERKEAENRIFKLAYFDSLTGLPNRQAFLERLAQEVRTARQCGGRLAVLFVDLDGFKNINDTLGHHAGDLILQWTADRLSQGMRPSDMVSRAADVGAKIELARLGGDEFTALIRDYRGPEDVLVAAHRLRDLMREAFVLEGRDVVMTASIGISLCPEDGADAATLLKHADSAMYHAKSKGGDNCQFYSASLTERAMQRLNLVGDLRRALDRNELSLAYQPQFDVASQRIQSVEALIRWQHPERGPVAPMDFIPLAEETGLIVPIGEWVLRTACAAALSWQRSGCSLGVAVNLSPKQFKNARLIDMVRPILTESGVAPSMLELEITESAVMEDSGATLATLNALRASGVKIALDDFGTGYSSMSYLKRMPLDNLKVDRRFVTGLPEDRENHAIVRAIVLLGQSLGFGVTAEGVETLEQAQILTQMGCDRLQGFYFSRPVPCGEIPALAAKRWPKVG